MSTEQETPPPDYVPAKWVSIYNKRELQWLAEQLHHRQQTARQDAQDARNTATAATARLAVLEAHNTRTSPNGANP